MCPQCDCEDFLGTSNSLDDNSTVTAPLVTTLGEFVASETIEEAASGDGKVVPMTTMGPTPWTVRKLDADGDNVYDDESGRWISQRACGLHMYPSKILRPMNLLINPLY